MADPVFRAWNDFLAPSPDANYGSVLPFAYNREGSGAWVQEGSNPRLAMPEWLRSAAQGVVGLGESTQTGSLTPEALATLTMGSVGTGATLGARGALASGASRPPIRAYHASPHSFDKFELRPGTGEGTAAFGQGLYLAENPKVSEEYLRQFKQGGGSGHMYEVNIHADPKRIIDDDLPFQRSGVSMEVIEKWREAKTAQERMEILRGAGFQGKKYADAGSRNVGGTESGTSNYVIFDPSIIEIMRKYGFAVPSPAVPGFSVAPPSQQPVQQPGFRVAKDMVY